MVKKVGRPPKLFQSEELEGLGLDLIHWLKHEGKQELMFVDWYYDRHNMFRHDWLDLINRPEFRTYYEIARRIMAKNIIKNKDIPQSYGNRYLAIYDRDVYDHEKEIKVQEAALKKSDVNDFAELGSNLQKLGEFLERLRSMQLSASKEPEASRKE